MNRGVFGMVGLWHRSRMHPFLAAGLGALLLVGAVFAVWRIVDELRAVRQFRAAQADLEAGDFPSARKRLAKCLEAWPNSSETHFLAARAARRNGDFADAFRELDAAEKLVWVPEAIELERALIRVPLGELPEVEKYLTSCVVQDHPDSALILEVLAPAYLRNFQLSEARHYAQLWTDSQPGSAPAWTCLGAVAERQQDREGALNAYRRAVEAAPDSYPDRLRLVRLLLEVFESTEALEQIESLRKAHPGDLTVKRELACCLILRGEAAQARPLLDEVLAERPNDSEALAARGRMELRAGRPAEAERWLRRAAEKTPFEGAIVHPFLRCLRLNGKEVEARRWDERLRKGENALKRLEKVTKAAAAAPHDPQPRYEAGMIFLQNGQEEEGLRWLISALRHAPGHLATHQALAEYYERKGQRQKAVEHRARIDPGKASSGVAPTPP